MGCLAYTMTWNSQSYTLLVNIVSPWFLSNSRGLIGCLGSKVSRVSAVSLACRAEQSCPGVSAALWRPLLLCRRCGLHSAVWLTTRQLNCSFCLCVMWRVFQFLAFLPLDHLPLSVVSQRFPPSFIPLLDDAFPAFLLCSLFSAVHLHILHIVFHYNL